MASSAPGSSASTPGAKAVPTPDSPAAGGSEASAVLSGALDLTGPAQFTVYCKTRLGGEFIPDAEVIAELVTWKPDQYPPSATFRKSGRTGPDGRCKFENMPYGDYSVGAMSSDYCGAARVPLRPERMFSGYKIEMFPRSGFGGTVKRENGDPVAGAVLYPIAHVLDLEHEFNHPDVALTRAITGAEGKFQFITFTPGGYKFFVLAPNYPPAFTDYISTMSGSAEIVLRDPGSVRGSVVDSDTGEKKPNIKLLFHQGKKVFGFTTDMRQRETPEAMQYRVSRETVSGPDGAYRLDNLAPGKYDVEIQDAALLCADLNATVTVPSGEATTYDIEARNGGVITGRVYYSESNDGVPDVKVKGARTAAISPRGCGRGSTKSACTSAIPMGTPMPGILRQHRRRCSLAKCLSTWISRCQR
jgi:hypothetical protein